mmetsp:Transcript_43309/g.115860  ORF Transcript_43309/g.115860 Transcript_43309/m.115860 type:complete len:84 (+) Transcript_43309:65-316(+)
MKNKTIQLVEKTKNDIGIVMRANKIEQAKVKVEILLREEMLIEAYETLGCLSELLLARFSMVETEKACPLELKVPYYFNLLLI